MMISTLCILHSPGVICPVRIALASVLLFTPASYTTSTSLDNKIVLYHENEVSIMYSIINPSVMQVDVDSPLKWPSKRTIQTLFCEELQPM